MFRLNPIIASARRKASKRQFAPSYALAPQACSYPANTPKCASLTSAEQEKQFASSKNLVEISSPDRSPPKPVRSTYPRRRRSSRAAAAVPAKRRSSPDSEALDFRSPVRFDARFHTRAANPSHKASAAPSSPACLAANPVCPQAFPPRCYDHRSIPGLVWSRHRYNTNRSL